MNEFEESSTLVNDGVRKTPGERGLCISDDQPPSPSDTLRPSAAGAAAVFDEVFAETWSQTPPTSPKSVLARVKAIATRFDQAAENWKARKSCLVELRELTEREAGQPRGGDSSDGNGSDSAHRHGFDPDTLRACKLMLIHALMELRSALVHEGCRALTALARTSALGMRSSSIGRDLLHALLEARGSANRTNAAHVEECTRVLVCHVESRAIPPLLLSTLRGTTGVGSHGGASDAIGNIIDGSDRAGHCHTNKGVRLTCLESAFIAAEKWGTSAAVTSSHADGAGVSQRRRLSAMGPSSWGLDTAHSPCRRSSVNFGQNPEDAQPFVHMVALGLQDASEPCRAAARKLFWAVERRWPAQAAQLKDRIEPRARKFLQAQSPTQTVPCSAGAVPAVTPAPKPAQRISGKPSSAVRITHPPTLPAPPAARQRRTRSLDSSAAASASQAVAALSMDAFMAAAPPRTRVQHSSSTQAVAQGQGKVHAGTRDCRVIDTDAMVALHAAHRRHVDELIDSVRLELEALSRFDRASELTQKQAEAGIADYLSAIEAGVRKRTEMCQDMALVLAALRPIPRTNQTQQAERECL